MNLISYLVAAALAAVLLAIVIRGIRNHKQGKSSCACGGDCSSCSHCGHGFYL